MLGFSLANPGFNAVFASATWYPPSKNWVSCCWVSCCEIANRVPNGDRSYPALDGVGWRLIIAVSICESLGLVPYVNVHGETRTTAAALAPDRCNRSSGGPAGGADREHPARQAPAGVYTPPGYGRVRRGGQRRQAQVHR